MRCHFPNPENLIGKICGRQATWLVKRSALGYPVNAPVQNGNWSMCDIHAAAVVVEMIADPMRRNAAMEMLRIEHANSFTETEELRGRRIGR